MPFGLPLLPPLWPQMHWHMWRVLQAQVQPPPMLRVQWNNSSLIEVIHEKKVKKRKRRRGVGKKGEGRRERGGGAIT